MLEGRFKLAFIELSDPDFKVQNFGVEVTDKNAIFIIKQVDGLVEINVILSSGTQNSSGHTVDNIKIQMSGVPLERKY